MLTLRHVEQNGYESLVLAESASFDKKENILRGFGIPGSNAAISNGVMAYGDGTVYVMNDNGKTVAVYNLS